jgi:flagellin-like hook-associated protein FlgL
LQNLEFIDLRLQDENVQLQSALSQDIDVDLVQAISDLTARQYAFEASLRTTASLLQLSLLNFL